MSDIAAVAMVIAILATTLLIAWPLVRALARRLEGGATKELLAELDGLRGRVQQLEEGQARLGELEERVDFAERMLAQSRETDRLPR
jgi:Tfp pilus assembly protein PilO